MSQKWRPISGVMIDCRRKATAEDKAKWGNRITYVHQCASCKEWFPRKMMTVDHIEPCGSLMDIEKDAGPFILRLLVERDGLQPLDNECHDAKTKQDRSGT
jgi:5-methylcytosine-specific restriction endonuclease McrA